MSCPYDACALEDFDAGRLSSDESAKMALHVVTCLRCRDELAWLKREQRLMAARAARSAGDAQRNQALWSGVAGRIAEQRRHGQPARRPADARSTIVLGGLLAASVLLFALFASQGGLRPSAVPEPVAKSLPASAAPAGDDDDPQIRAALDEAEAEYAAAAAALERRYRQHRGSLAPERASRVDSLLAHGRPALQNAAAGNVETRQVMLATHADYVHALHSLVGGMEVVP